MNPSIKSKNQVAGINNDKGRKKRTEDCTVSCRNKPYKEEDGETALIEISMLPSSHIKKEFRNRLKLQPMNNHTYNKESIQKELGYLPPLLFREKIAWRYFKSSIEDSPQS
ncbi:MAG: hypothetical protein IAA97_09385 [Spirochaetes bacterium]|uniref:Uncharacterized protein n=1 Tax=Candidatus Ornithospirochaeta stercoripullorum TaxID=2840899 RepID=A0A9D9E4X5_9SPIO|nr:hypothetical protein [Candidatus Ornithospirochaeta stercoripullorum]